MPRGSPGLAARDKHLKRLVASWQSFGKNAGGRLGTEPINRLLRHAGQSAELTETPVVHVVRLVVAIGQYELIRVNGLRRQVRRRKPLIDGHFALVATMFHKRVDRRKHFVRLATEQFAVCFGQMNHHFSFQELGKQKRKTKSKTSLMHHRSSGFGCRETARPASSFFPCQRSQRAAVGLGWSLHPLVPILPESAVAVMASVREMLHKMRREFGTTAKCLELLLDRSDAALHCEENLVDRCRRERFRGEGCTDEAAIVRGQGHAIAEELVPNCLRAGQTSAGRRGSPKLDATSQVGVEMNRTPAGTAGGIDQTIGTGDLSLKPLTVTSDATKGSAYRRLGSE